MGQEQTFESVDLQDPFAKQSQKSKVALNKKQMLHKMLATESMGSLQKLQQE